MNVEQIISAYLSGALHHTEAIDALTRGATRPVKVARARDMLREALLRERGEELELGMRRQPEDTE